MDFNSLKIKQRELRHGFSEGLGLRVHRALSWLDKSEQCGDDQDSQFIFLWIAFNAVYAQESNRDNMTESKTFSAFIAKIVELDKSNRLYELLWNEFSSSVRVLLGNKYIYQPFWDYHNGAPDADDWRERFSKTKIAANCALAAKNTQAVIAIVLSRLYTLRNQLIHGGATWQSSANRDQIRDGVAFLGKLVPIIIDIMIENSDTLWGDAHYPLIEE